MQSSFPSSNNKYSFNKYSFWKRLLISSLRMIQIAVVKFKIWIDISVDSLVYGKDFDGVGNIENYTSFDTRTHLVIFRHGSLLKFEGFIGNDEGLFEFIDNYSKQNRGAFAMYSKSVANMREDIITNVVHGTNQ